MVGDRLIAQAAARVIAGQGPQFDNAAALVEPYLQAVIQAAATWDNLVDSVRQGGDELIALAQQLTEDQAAIRIPSRVVSDGEAVLDASVPVGSLVQAPANVHLRGHAEQLAALATRRQPAAVS